MAKELMLLLLRPTEKWDLILFAVNLLVCSVWYTLSLRLRKINIEIKFNRQIFQKYLSAASLMESSTTLEDLDVQFFDLVKKWPQYEPDSTKSYHLRKENLLTNAVQ